ncbi:MAG: hypothetical protein ACYTEL_17025 [Planctomycetota bacterium]
MLRRPDIRRNHILLACAVIVAGTGATGRATTLRKLSLGDLVAHADTIVVGKCEKAQTIWLARKVYTLATVRVSRPVKGKADPNSTIKVYILGGRVRKPMPIKMHVPGAAKVAQGEEMLLFLRATGPRNRHHRFVGMTQGKIPIKTDPKTGKRNISYPERIKGVRWVDRDRRPVDPGPRAEPAEEGGFEGFLGRLKQIMADQEAEAKKAAQQEGRSKNAPPKQKGGAK